MPTTVRVPPRRDLGEMLRELPRDAVLDLTPELSATLIASISAVSRTADAIHAELEKAAAE